MPDDMWMQCQHERGAQVVCAIELIAVQLEQRLRRRHRPTRPEIRRFRQGPVDCQFHHAGRFTIGHDLIRLVHRAEAAVVEEIRFADQTKRVLAERPRRGTIPYRPFAGRLRQVIDCQVEEALLFGGAAGGGWKLVDPSVNPDLVTARLHDRRDHFGMQQRTHRGNEEGR